MVYLGIDVGKHWHEAALLDEAAQVIWRHRFRPTRGGLQAFEARLRELDPATVTVGLEATGSYWLTLHAWLSNWGAQRVVVLNPFSIRCRPEPSGMPTSAGARPTASMR